MSTRSFKTIKGSDPELFLAVEQKENMPPGYLGTEYGGMVEADFRTELKRQGFDDLAIEEIIVEARHHAV
jgi:hypothetical protein